MFGQTATAVPCKDCGRQADYSFCAHCGQKTNTRRLDGETLLEGIIEVGLHASGRLLHTDREMLFRPGETIRAYLNGRRRTYQDPVSFFACGYVLVEALNLFVIEPQHLPQPLFIRLGREWSFLCMTIAAMAAHVIAAKPALNLIETVVMFAFVDGVTFLYAAFLILLSALFANQVLSLDATAQALLLDLPYLAIVIFYFVWVYRTVIRGPAWRLLAAIGVDLGVFALVWIGAETQLLETWFQSGIALD